VVRPEGLEKRFEAIEAVWNRNESPRPSALVPVLLHTTG
jgi:hypothetical protein